MKWVFWFRCKLRGKEKDFKVNNMQESCLNILEIYYLYFFINIYPIKEYIL